MQQAFTFLLGLLLCHLTNVFTKFSFQVLCHVAFQVPSRPDFAFVNLEIPDVSVFLEIMPRFCGVERLCKFWIFWL